MSKYSDKYGLTLGDAVKRVAELIAPVAAEEAAQQARILVGSVTGLSDAELLQRKSWLFPGELYDVLDTLTEKRVSGAPLQYILGRWEFMGLPFFVREGVLIPRQDTETLVEHALTLAGERGYKRVLDICCGSGCIGVALAKLGALEVTLSDIDAGCAELSRANAGLNGVSCEVVCGDMFEALETSAVNQSYDMIVCNPPYLSAADMKALQKEVTFEPALALYGGSDGLDFYRRLRDAAPYLNKGGALVMEVGAGQARDVLSLFGGDYAIKDVNGIERVVVVTRNN